MQVLQTLVTLDCYRGSSALAIIRDYVLVRPSTISDPFQHRTIDRLEEFRSAKKQNLAPSIVAERKVTKITEKLLKVQ